MKILSLDGGGIRGVLTATILQRVEKARPGFTNKIGLFAGTSTGGLLALGLASGMRPNGLPGIYHEHGATIFKRSLGAKIGDLFGLSGAKYGTENLKSVLEKYFSTLLLDDLNPVCVTTMDLEGIDRLGIKRWKPKVYNNLESQDANELVVDVAVKTASAPTYFPVYGGEVDGGVFGTCPAMIAAALALRFTTIDRLAILSLGTGRVPQSIPGEDLDWGIAQWAKQLVPLLLGGTADITEYQLESFFGEQSFRLNPILDREVEMDNVKELDYLTEVGSSVDIDPLLDWMERVDI